jgi:hypothetical protein
MTSMLSSLAAYILVLPLAGMVSINIPVSRRQNTQRKPARPCHQDATLELHGELKVLATRRLA